MTCARIGFLIAIVATVSSCASATSTPAGNSAPATASSLASQPLTSDLLTILQRMAVQWGDASPTEMRYVATTYGAAFAVEDRGGSNSVIGHPELSSAPVYLLEASGNFQGASAAPRPPGAAAPAGTNLSIILDASTLRIEDLGVTNQPDDLSSLGVVIHL
jgi:hypothetical protein